MNDSSLRIYVMTHKKANVLSDDVYTPLLLGACNHEDDYGYLCDDVGENISDKNSSYCELTGLYWMWKHSDADYVGLVHYRRYFINHFLGDYLSKEEVFKYLKNYDIIVPSEGVYNLHSVKKEFINYYIYEKDFDIVQEIISEFYPDYLDAFDKFFNSHHMVCNSMFICRKDMIDKYCEWIFDILSKLEQYIDLSEYKGNRGRIYGYFAEVLFNVWLIKNDFNMKHFYLKHTESNDFIMQILQVFPRLRGPISLLTSKLR